MAKSKTCQGCGKPATRTLSIESHQASNAISQDDSQVFGDEISMDFLYCTEGPWYICDECCYVHVVGADAHPDFNDFV